MDIEEHPGRRQLQTGHHPVMVFEDYLIAASPGGALWSIFEPGTGIYLGCISGGTNSGILTTSIGRGRITQDRVGTLRHLFYLHR